MDDVILNKAAIIERCLKHIEEEKKDRPDLNSDYTRQNSIILDILRARKASIDMNMHVIQKRKLEIPQSAKESFEILANNNILSEELATKMQRMAGFRHVALHEHQRLDIEIVKTIIEKHFDDFRAFQSTLLKQ